jgi:hypothetical protein
MVYFGCTLRKRFCAIQLTLAHFITLTFRKILQATPPRFLCIFVRFCSHFFFTFSNGHWTGWKIIQKSHSLFFHNFDNSRNIIDMAYNCHLLLIVHLPLGFGCAIVVTAWLHFFSSAPTSTSVSLRNRPKNPRLEKSLGFLNLRDDYLRHKY